MAKKVGAKKVEPEAKSSSALPIKKAPKRKRNQKGYKRVDHQTRIDIIYDNKVHNIQINELIEKYGINYNTVRHIVLQYTESGRTDVRNFKRNFKPKSIQAANGDSDFDEERGYESRELEPFEEEKVADDVDKDEEKQHPTDKRVKKMDPINYEYFWNQTVSEDSEDVHNSLKINNGHQIHEKDDSDYLKKLNESEDEKLCMNFYERYKSNVIDAKN